MNTTVMVAVTYEFDNLPRQRVQITEFPFLIGHNAQRANLVLRSPRGTHTGISCLITTQGNVPVLVMVTRAGPLRLRSSSTSPPVVLDGPNEAKQSIPVQIRDGAVLFVSDPSDPVPETLTFEVAEPSMSIDSMVGESFTLPPLVPQVAWTAEDRAVLAALLIDGLCPQPGTDRARQPTAAEISVMLNAAKDVFDSNTRVRTWPLRTEAVRQRLTMLRNKVLDATGIELTSSEDLFRWCWEHCLSDLDGPYVKEMRVRLDHYREVG